MPKASDNIKIYRNPNGPVVSTVNRRVLEQDGLTFKDIDGTGTLSPVNDWRNSPAERAAAYVKTLSVKEKIAQLFISDWRMAKYPITGPMADLYKDIEKKTDETGILDEGEFRGKTIFGEQYLPGTSPLLKDWFNRHVGSGVQLPQREWRAGVRNERCGRRAGNLARYLGHCRRR